MSNTILYMSVSLLFIVACGGDLGTDRDKTTAMDTSGYSTEVGGGGSGIRCQKDAHSYFEVLDIYEARKRGMPPALGAKHLSVPEKLEIAFARLERLSPVRANRYRARAKFILENARFFTSGRLTHINDQDPADIDMGCSFVQIATRRNPLFENDPEFLIDKQLYDQLDADNQAALIIHEVAYEEAAKEYEHRTSRMARGFISLFISNRLDTMSTRDLFEFLAKAEFKFTDYAQLQVPTKVSSKARFPGAIQFKGTQPMWAGWAIEQIEGELSVPHQTLPYAQQELRLGGGISLSVLFEGGRIRQIVGHVSVVNSSGSEPYLRDRGNEIILAQSFGGMVFEFDDEGRFRLLTAGPGSRLKTRNGIVQTTAVATCILLRADGEATVLNNSTCGDSSSKTSEPQGALLEEILVLLEKVSELDRRELKNEFDLAIRESSEKGLLSFYKVLANKLEISWSPAEGIIPLTSRVRQTLNLPDEEQGIIQLRDKVTEKLVSERHVAREKLVLKTGVISDLSAIESFVATMATKYGLPNRPAGTDRDLSARLTELEKSLNSLLTKIKS